ncbi:uncharacterized protein LOC129310973 isoform X2 [Prosopis cineraria]|uniref:uncharacterized protein LOC129310973 isoform X2 n=1 Tax=Prosopis cineraria TaxID=364024 RepID=UPI00240EFE2C|nr:uncharacterized protein LOC129310973 isoform X2 [Prosopis cineraria]
MESALSFVLSKPIHIHSIPNTHWQISHASQEESGKMRAGTSGSRDSSFHPIYIGDTPFPSCLPSSSSAVSSFSFSSRDSFPASSTPLPTTQNSRPEAEMSTDVNNPGGLHLMSSGTSCPLLISSSDVSSREEDSALSSFSSAIPVTQDSQPSVPFHLSHQLPLSSIFPSQQGPATSLRNSQPANVTTRTDPDDSLPWGKILFSVAAAALVGASFTARHLTTAVKCVAVITECISIFCILIVHNLFSQIPRKTIIFLEAFGQSMVALGLFALSFDLLPRYLKFFPVLLWVGVSISAYFGATSEREGIQRSPWNSMTAI